MTEMFCLDQVGILLLDSSLILWRFLLWEFEGSSLGGWNVNTLKFFFFLEGLLGRPNFKPFTMFGRLSWVGLGFFSIKGMVWPSIASSKLPSCSVCGTSSVYKTLVYTIGIDVCMVKVSITTCGVKVLIVLMLSIFAIVFGTVIANTYSSCTC